MAGAGPFMPPNVDDQVIAASIEVYYENIYSDLAYLEIAQAFV